MRNKNVCIAFSLHDKLRGRFLTLICILYKNYIMWVTMKEPRGRRAYNRPPEAKQFRVLIYLSSEPDHSEPEHIGNSLEPESY